MTPDFDYDFPAELPIGLAVVSPVGVEFLQGLAMRIGRDLRMTGAMEFAQASRNGRISHYQQQAAQLREMASSEPVGQLQENLLELAKQYEQLAASMTVRNMV